MALDTYANLQAAILTWLMRPGDSTVSPSVPDMITLFEEEARDRLKTRFSEAETTLSTVGGIATVALPSDFWELRSIKLNTDPVAKLVYVTPEQMDDTWVSTGNDQPIAYTIEGLNLRLAPTPDSAYTIDIGYMQGVAALSSAAPTNWLLTHYPSLYLFGALAEAEAFIGEDERIALWLQRRDAAFDRVRLADIKARWGGGALQVKTDTGNP